MAKKVKIKPKVEKKIKPAKPIIEEPVNEGDQATVIAGSLPVASVIEPAVEPVKLPEVVTLPKGVLKIEEVEINGKRYKKFWRSNGTTDVTLIG